MCGSFNDSPFRGFPISNPYTLASERVASRLWLFRGEKVVKSSRGSRWTIDFTCFLSEIALFLSLPPSPPPSRRRTLAFRVTAKIDTISRTSRSPGWSTSRRSSPASAGDWFNSATRTARPANLFKRPFALLILPYGVRFFLSDRENELLFFFFLSRNCAKVFFFIPSKRSYANPNLHISKCNPE